MSSAEWRPLLSRSVVMMRPLAGALAIVRLIRLQFCALISATV